MHWLGLQGMPRRVVEYAPSLQSVNVVASIGAFIIGISVLPFIVNALLSWAWGPKAVDNPWQALTLEWQTTSPPPVYNFATPPVVEHGPYDYAVGITPWGAPPAPAPSSAAD